MPKVNVKYLGPARDWSGAAEEQIEVAAGETVNGMLLELGRRIPQLAAARGIRMAVNRAYVKAGYLLNDGDEVAVIPPVSGG